MSKKIYKKFSEVEAEIKRLGCKHVKLQNLDHQDLIPFNPHKKPIGPKLLEIKKKLSVLPDAVYCIVCQDRFGKNVGAQNFYLGKGTFDESLSESVQQNQNNSSTNSDHLLSLDSAVEKITENANLKAENASLKSKNTELEQKILKLEAKIEHLEEVNEDLSMQEEVPANPFSGLSEFFKELSPVLPGIADRWFDLKKDEQDLKKARFLAENGYELPGAKKANGQINKTSKTKSNNLDRVAEPGSEQWAEYIESVLNLPEEQFNQHLALVKKQYPKIYPELCSEVFEEVEEEEEHEEDPE